MTQICERVNIIASFGDLQVARFNEEAHYGNVSNWDRWRKAGVHHARRYEGIENMKVIAICEIDEERLKGAVEELNVPGYTDYVEMLEKEKPDIVHAVTEPTVPRHIWVEPAAEAGVKALVIEKPLALRPSEAEALAAAHEKTGLKIIVNHQRRYLPLLKNYWSFLPTIVLATYTSSVPAPKATLPIWIPT